jgi:hypothetical protein
LQIIDYKVAYEMFKFAEGPKERERERERERKDEAQNFGFYSMNQFWGEKKKKKKKKEKKESKVGTSLGLI